MADWWEQDTQSGGTATASKWWENDPEPGMRTETLPNDQPFQMADGTSFNELMQTAIAGQPAARQANIDRMVGTLPEDATRLEELNFKRRQELITGEPANPTGDKRLDDITRQRLAKEIADMNAKRLGPDEMLLEERYQAEQDPLTNLINAPIMRGAMTGVQNAASSIADTALRILPGEGAPSQLADKIGRQRASEGQYQAYLDEKQGAPAALPNTVTQMTGEYLPLSASGVPAALQVGVKGANDAYLKSDDHTYALTSGIVQGALTYAGGKLAGGTWIDMIGGKVAGKKLAPLLKGFGIESGEELGQLYGQALIDRGFGVGDGSMPTAKDAVWTLATVLGARGFGSAMSAGIEDDGVNKPSVESRAYDAMRKFAERKWPSRKLAKEAGVDQVATTAKERSELATDIRNRLTGQQFEEQLRAAAVSPEQADLDMEVWRARAVAAGESFDEFVGKRVKGIEKTTSDKSVYLAQRQSGKPDALAQDQPTPVDTPEFKAWFGESKVADAEGKPLRVYHGTSDDFDSFNLDHKNRKDTGWLGTGVYLTTSQDIASSYANLKPGYAGKNVMALYAKVENPYYATIKDKQRLQLISNRSLAEGREAADAWTAELKAKGHDGVILRFNESEVGKANASEEIVVFSPSAVKSATGNSGKFDPNDPSILAQAAYHGSPYKFDKFTTDAMGTGEGQQAYGWGLYFAGNEAVAKYYREALSSPARSVQKKAMEEYDQGVDPQEAADLLFARTDLSPIERKLLESLRDNDWLGFDYPHQAVKAAMTKDFASRFDPTPELVALVEDAKKRSGALYKVNLKPEEHEYLDWDKPLYQQSPQVMEALSALFGDDFSLADISGGSAYHRLMDMVDDDRESRGAKIGSVVDAKKAVSRMLNAHGVRGIQYFDGASRKRGEGHRNYVIFDDADVVIEEVLAQKNTPKPRGEIQFHADDGRATIRLFEGANESTFIHESAHLFRRDLQGEELKKAERWAGVRNGNWGRKNKKGIAVAEEKFARGFERYLREGIAPNKSLETIFARFKAALTKVYGAIKGTAIDVNISPEMRTVFDRLLTPSETNTQTQGATNGQVQTEGRAQGQVARAPHPLDDNSPLELGTFPPPESDILSQDLADRFRGLANQTTLPEARAANYEADVAMGFPQHKEWAVAEQKVAQRIKADPTGELSRVIERINQANATGGTIHLADMEDVALVNRLSEMMSMDLSTPESRDIFRKLRFAYREARSEDARKTGYRDPTSVMEPGMRRRKDITDAIAEPSPEEIKARKEARTPEQHAEVDRAMEERYNAAKERLDALGVDINDIDSILADPKKAAIVLNAFRPKHGFWDMLFEYRRNSILSGILTQATNITGNLTFAPYKMTVERGAEAFVNLFAKDKTKASFGEFKYLAAGVLPGIQRGLRNAMTSWSTEMPALAYELGRDDNFKIEGARGAIPGKFGRLVRAIGYRPLAAADELATSITATMEVGARAYRAGKSIGLEGEELSTFIQQQIDDIGSVAWTDAVAAADQAAFRGHKGVVAEAAVWTVDLLRKIPGVRYVIPFRDTPASIFEEGLKRVPALGAIIEYAEARKHGKNVIDSGMTPALARQLISMGALAVIWEAVGGDDPWITGAGDQGDPTMRDVAQRARPPQSIRLGGQWYSYSRVEPFATIIATTADMAKSMQDGKPLAAVPAFGNQIKSKLYLDSIGDTFDMINKGLEGDYSGAEKWLTNFNAGWVPNLYRQTISATEDEMPETRFWGKDKDRVNRFLKRNAQAMKVPFVDTSPRYDIWGRPITYNEIGDSFATSFPLRLVFPSRVKDIDKIQQADLALIRWNEKHPDNPEVYSEPNKWVEIQDQTQYLTDEQHAQYAELSGQLAQQYVSGIAFDPVNPTAQQIARIKKAIANARERARKQLIPTWTFD